MGLGGAEEQDRNQRATPPSLTCHFCCPLGIFGLSAISQAYILYVLHLPTQAPASAPLFSTHRLFLGQA